MLQNQLLPTTVVLVTVIRRYVGGGNLLEDFPQNMLCYALLPTLLRLVPPTDSVPAAVAESIEQSILYGRLTVHFLAESNQ